ncbi:ribose-phosphate pyrophosphokinase 2, chloroplastic-like [Vicia villosa]|uniref:ribose-phosphate pyrophosphokinase 2, chloroplastic-like n=1 Tax=Vicia villosa TaxID=3911 RepID=UPI00273B2CBD|nr:ribose-phosphate pyrophosphokinase 2, chloroplastic-like [Vicia villosa]
MKESFEQYASLLSQDVKPVDLTELSSSKEQALASLQAEPQSDWKLAVQRHGHNVAEVMNLIGDVKGKVAVMVDDMIDTAGTIAKGAALLHQEGAREVYACTTHAVFRYIMTFYFLYIIYFNLGFVLLRHFNQVNYGEMKNKGTFDPLSILLLLF